MKISNELISEVMQLNILGFNIKNNIIEVYRIGYFEINIYEFAFLCKDWAYRNGFFIYSTKGSAGAGKVYITEADDTEQILNTFSRETELKAIFEACEWLLKQGRINEN